jgi:MATE family, multidrug efflux pump
VQLAAHGIVLQIASVTFMVHLGLAHAATVRAGNAFGRKDSLNLRRGALVASLASAAFALICSVLFITAPDFLINLFLDPLEPARDQVLALGATLLVLAALFQLADGGQAISLGLLRGLQDMRVPMIHATISYWLVGLTASYIMAFPLGFGAAGVWAGLVAGLASAWVLMGLRFWRQKSWLR